MSKIFINEIINEKKDINNEIFAEYFGYQNPSFLAKDLFNVNQGKYEEIINLPA